MVEWAVPYYCYSANSAPPIAPPPPSSLLSIVPLVPSLSIETNVCPLSLLNLPRPQNVLEKKKNRIEKKTTLAVIAIVAALALLGLS